ncbi:glutaredoxin 3 [Litorimonas taeanensis]|uniref:Glutaredoxin n=1 Tax=Litorimonas taeanensis TaxID=568099 RepID=A0A420WF12_9PROT|nr:glutaredoxin 3 [Litorimonas taeanensis]RKQ69576.1 glutaredoxin 3 [Litorimonas taeanensis]
MAKVEMYTKMGCPFCIRAKALLKSKGVDIIEIPAAMNKAKRAEMNERSGRNTFPQIFIDGKHIGGSDDLAALEAKGGLDPLLAK